MFRGINICLRSALRRPMLSPSSWRPSVAVLPGRYGQAPLSYGTSSSQKRHFWSNEPPSQKDPYQVLGVSRNATAQEIKIAYFREAKKCHPDLNPGDKNATKRFQELSNAYEAIKDPSKRYSYSGSSDAATEEQQQQAAEETFNDVWGDVEVVTDAISSIGRDVQEEIELVFEAAKAGDWNTVWESAKENKGFIVGVILPLAVVLRFPAAVFLALRAAGAVVPWVVVPLIRTGHATVLTRMIWRRIVTEARAKAAMRQAGQKRR